MNTRFPRSKCGIRVGLTCVLLAALFLSLASAAEKDDDQIPPLRPPLEEIKPGFWEQHAFTVVTGGLLAVGALAALAWLLLRPRPAEEVPPGVVARLELQKLRELPEDGNTLSLISRLLRAYFTRLLGLLQEELTTTEFCARLAQRSEIPGELAVATTEFLRQCDERKFSPRPPHTAASAMAEALRLVDLGDNAFADHQQREAAAAQTRRSTPTTS